MNGVFGPIKSYYGTVESQGRGSLHLHMLLWLNDTPSPARLREAIKSETYRRRLIDYLEDIIKEDVSWINSSIISSLIDNKGRIDDSVYGKKSIF